MKTASGKVARTLVLRSPDRWRSCFGSRMLTASGCSAAGCGINRGVQGRGVRGKSQTKEEIKICRPKTARFEFSRVFWATLLHKLPAPTPTSTPTLTSSRHPATPPRFFSINHQRSKARGSCIIKICKSRFGHSHSSWGFAFGLGFLIQNVVYGLWHGGWRG